MSARCPEKWTEGRWAKRRRAATFASVRALASLRCPVVVALAACVAVAAAPARASVGWELPAETVVPLANVDATNGAPLRSSALTGDGSIGVVWVSRDPSASLNASVRPSGGSLATTTLEAPNPHAVRLVSLTADDT